MPRLFGAKLRHLRHARALTQTQLATHLSLAAYTHVSKLEGGQRAPSLDLVLHSAGFFGVSTDYLLRDTIPVVPVGEPVPRGSAEAAVVIAGFGATLRALRSRRGLSQRDLAGQLGLASRVSIANMEAGRKLPSLTQVVQLADILGVTTDHLLQHPHSFTANRPLPEP